MPVAALSWWTRASTTSTPRWPSSTTTRSCTTPGAFADESQGVLRELYPDAVIATEADAEVFGLNAVSDGRHVLMPPAATQLMDELRERGYEPIGVELSELLKSGGSAKCCTLELRAARR